MPDASDEHQRMLATVQASPAAVAGHDKSQWLALFARYNIVEDPVGSRPHICGLFDSKSGSRSDAPLSRFYDTFIAPNTIVFDVERDIVCDEYVLRDLNIEIAMGSRVKVVVPMHLLYQLQQQHGEFKIFRLAAHWELLPMVKQALGFGFSSIKIMSALGWRMLRLQGISGIVGFSRALATVGTAGKDKVAAFARAYNNGDAAAIEALFKDRQVVIEWPVPQTHMQAGSVLAQQGSTLYFDKLLSSGRTVSASAWMDSGAEQRCGVVLFEFSAGLTLERVSAYWQGAAQATSSSSGS
jgi:hypothetical protein